MGKGYLTLQVRSEDDALPIADAHIVLKDHAGKAMYETHTDANGDTEPLELQAPDKAHTLDESYKKPAYSEWNVDVSKAGFVTSQVQNVEVVDGETAILPVHLHPLVDEPGAPRDEDIDIPPMLPVLPPAAQQIPYQEDGIRQAVPAEFAPANPHQAIPPSVAEGPDGMVETVERQVFIPDFIRVHLGAPTNTAARNVRVPFVDYIKNVTNTKQ